MVEQEVREAYMNSTLAKHWLAGEDWAALDYNGLELSHAEASAHHAKNQEVMLSLRQFYSQQCFRSCHMASECGVE